MLKKRLKLILVANIVALCLFELTSGYALFWYQKIFKVKNIWTPDQSFLQTYEDSGFAIFSAIKTIQKGYKKKELARIPKDIVGDPISLFQTKHNILGWVPKPGTFKIIIKNHQPKDCRYPAFHDWTCTFYENGERNTGWKKETEKQTKTVWIFGESWIQGWALDDSLTFPFQLQGMLYPKTKVRAFANGSWGTLHALRLVDLYKNIIKSEDIIIINFADWIMPRNVPSPSVVKSILENRKKIPELYNICLPLYNKDPNERLTSILELNEDAEKYSAQSDPNYEELCQVTKSIFDQIKTLTKAKVLILLVDETSNTMKEYLNNNFTLVNAVPSKDIWQKDDVLPYDAHPGPIQNNFWAQVLYNYLNQNEK